MACLQQLCQPFLMLQAPALILVFGFLCHLMSALLLRPLAQVTLHGYYFLTALESVLLPNLRFRMSLTHPSYRLIDTI